jgi:hypothetical protein
MLGLVGVSVTMTVGAEEWVAARAATPPRIDGRLDDPVWRSAPAVRGLVDFVPEPGRAPSQPTEVRVAWDDRGLYFAFRCHDAQPARIRSRMAKRDAAFDDDWAGVILDPAAEARGAIELMVNPHGCVMDAFVSPGAGGDDVAVDFDFTAAALQDSAGWSAELAVPWASLGGRASRRMAAFALRQIRRTGERASWPAIEAGRQDWLAGAATLDPAPGASGHGVEVLPVVTLHRCDTRADRAGWQAGTARAKLGLTASAAPRPDLRLAFALRPDFSHVEADAPQVTLNRRFPIVLPEKRAFFLEDRDLFDVAAEGDALAAVFHSRAIVAPTAAVRAAGRVGAAHRLGLLWARDAPPGERPVRCVWLRGRSYIGGASYVGICAGARVGEGAAPDAPGAGGISERRAAMAGLDADLVLSRAVRVAAHALGSRAGVHTGHAIALELGWSGTRRTLDLVYQEISPDFLAVTGFLSRSDTRQGTIEGAWHVYPRVPGCRRLTARIAATTAADFSGAPTDRRARLALRLETAGPSALQLSRTLAAEWWSGRRFDAGAWQVTGESAPLSWLRLTASGTRAATPIYASEPQPGRSRTTAVGLTLRPCAWLAASGEATRVTLRRVPAPAKLSSAQARRVRLELQPHRTLRVRATLDDGNGGVRRQTDWLAELSLAPGTTLQLGWGNAYAWEPSSGGEGRTREVSRVAFLKAAYGLRP